MDNTKNDSFYRNEMAVLTQRDENYTEYALRPKYGEGKIVMFPVVPGLLLAYSYFSRVRAKVFNDEPRYQNFTAPMLKIGYGIEGRFSMENSAGKTCSAGEGWAIYYNGSANVSMIEFTDQAYESINILGFSENITATLREVFQLDPEKVVC